MILSPSDIHIHLHFPFPELETGSRPILADDGHNLESYTASLHRLSRYHLPWDQ